MLAAVQDYLLCNSIQMLWHMVLVIMTRLDQQRQLSVKILSAMFTGNKRTKRVLERILPDKLLGKKKLEHPDLQIQYRNYIQFFSEVFLGSFKTAEE